MTIRSPKPEVKIMVEKDPVQTSFERWAQPGHFTRNFSAFPKRLQRVRFPIGHFSTWETAKVSRSLKKTGSCAMRLAVANRLSYYAKSGGKTIMVKLQRKPGPK